MSNQNPPKPPLAPPATYTKDSQIAGLQTDIIKLVHQAVGWGYIQGCANQSPAHERDSDAAEAAGYYIEQVFNLGGK